MLSTVIETNFMEAISFLKLYFSPIVCISLIMGLWLGLLIVKKAKTYLFLMECRIVKFFPLYILLSLMGGIAWGYEFFLLTTKEYSCEYRNHLIFMTPIRDLCFLNNAKRASILQKEYIKKYRELFDNQKFTLNAKNNVENIVLILGESLTKSHMEIYGYSRGTNPLLKQWVSVGGGGGNIIVFDNVVSPHAQTTLSLRKVLTYLNYENEKDIEIIYGYGNLVSTFNLAKYTTFWISNQMDKNNGIVGTIASFATHSDFVSRYKQTFDDVFFDEKVVTSLDRMRDKKTQKNMYVIHLMGSHASYGNRYPKNYNVFNDSLFSGRQRTISRYDNSVLYNDYIISEIFQRFSDSDSVVVYISDHGEELYENGDFLGHSDDRISRFMVEIPMLVFCSRIFIEKHPTIYEQLVKNKKTPYMTDDLIHTILDLAGIDDISVFDKTRSLINEDFNSKRVRMVGGIQGRDYDRVLKHER